MPFLEPGEHSYLPCLALLLFLVLMMCPLKHVSLLVFPSWLVQMNVEVAKFGPSGIQPS